MASREKNRGNSLTSSPIDPLPPVTTVAQQDEARAEQEVDAFPDDELGDSDNGGKVAYEEKADVDTASEDRKEIKAEPNNNVYIKGEENYREINTRCGAVLATNAKDETEALEDETNGLAKEIESLLADVEVEIGDIEVKAQLINDVYIHEKANDIDINTPYKGEINVQVLTELWQCKRCGSLDTEKVIRGKSDDDWYS